MSTACHVVIRGRVQGVGFRALVEYEAARRSLVGWVRNRRDGSVEAVFEGPDDMVAEMIEVCRLGPPAARVEEFDQRAATAEDLARGARRGFMVLPTA